MTEKKELGSTSYETRSMCEEKKIHLHRTTVLPQQEAYFYFWSNIAGNRTRQLICLLYLKTVVLRCTDQGFSQVGGAACSKDALCAETSQVKKV